MGKLQDFQRWGCDVEHSSLGGGCLGVLIEETLGSKIRAALTLNFFLNGFQVQACWVLTFCKVVVGVPEAFLHRFHFNLFYTRQGRAYSLGWDVRDDLQITGLRLSS